MDDLLAQHSWMKKSFDLAGQGKAGASGATGSSTGSGLGADVEMAGDLLEAGEEKPHNFVDLKTWAREKDELDRHFFKPEKPGGKGLEATGAADSSDSEGDEDREQQWSSLESQR
eukprot:6416874-Lingulodinium_polyedra.AAC.1